MFLERGDDCNVQLVRFQSKFYLFITNFVWGEKSLSREEGRPVTPGGLTQGVAGGKTLPLKALTENTATPFGDKFP